MFVLLQYGVAEAMGISTFRRCTLIPVCSEARPTKCLFVAIANIGDVRTVFWIAHGHVIHRHENSIIKFIGRDNSLLPGLLKGVQ